MAYEIGWPFEFATLLQHPQYTHLWGYVQYSRALETREDLNLWVPTFLAGQFGEVALLGYAGPGGSQDNRMVMDQVRAHIGTGPEAMDLFQNAYQRARDTIQTQVETVRIVSIGLLERETLNYAEVRDLIEDSTSDKTT